MAIKQLGAAPVGSTDTARLVDIPGSPASVVKGAVTTSAFNMPATAAPITGLTFELAPGTYLMNTQVASTKSNAAGVPRIQIGDEDSVGVGVSGGMTAIVGTGNTPSAAQVTAPNTAYGFTHTNTQVALWTVTAVITVPTGAATWTVSIRAVITGTGTGSVLAGSFASFTPITP